MREILKSLATIAAVALAGAAIAASVGSAIAAYGWGEQPGTGPQLVDGRWLNALSGGVNRAYQYGITAAGSSSQTAAFQLPALIQLFSVDTVTANSGVALPPCLQGTEIELYNSSGTNVLVYPSIANNPVTAAQDTINNATSVTVNSHTSEIFFCPKNGIWGAK